MSLTKEDLLAIAQVIDEKLDEKLEEKLEQKLEEKLQPIREQLNRLEQRIEKLEQRMDAIELRMDKLEARMDALEVRMDKLEVRMDQSEEKLIRLTGFAELDFLPRLQNIESCYTATHHRYVATVDRIESMQTDIGIIKEILIKHSEVLQYLA